MKKDETPLFRQKTLKAIVVCGTGLGLGVMLGSLAAIRGRSAAGLQWSWSWLSLLWFLAGAGFNWRFWNVVWKAQETPTRHNKSKFVYHLFIFAVIGLGSFLYPIRFVSSIHYFDIAQGLFTAVLFLGGVGVMIYKIGQAIFVTDRVEVS